MRRYRYGVWGLGALLVCAALAWAQARQPFSTVPDFLRGFQLNGSTTITGSATAGNASVVLPTGAIGGAELAAGYLRVAYCGQLAENGEIFLGAPALTTVEPVLADATCDGLDSGTEATADVVLSAILTLYPRYMRCILNGTLGASETLTAQLRDDTANVTGVACSMAAGETTCEVATPTAAAIAAGSATAVEANEASDNSDDDLKCIILYAVH